MVPSDFCFQWTKGLSRSVQIFDIGLWDKQAAVEACAVGCAINLAKVHSYTHPPPPAPPHPHPSAPSPFFFFFFLVLRFSAKWITSCEYEKLLWNKSLVLILNDKTILEALLVDYISWVIKFYFVERMKPYQYIIDK